MGNTTCAGDLFHPRTQANPLQPASHPRKPHRCRGGHSARSQRNVNQLQPHQTVSAALHKDVQVRQYNHCNGQSHELFAPLFNISSSKAEAQTDYTIGTETKIFFFQVCYIPLLHRAHASGTLIQTFRLIQFYIDHSKTVCKPSGFLPLSPKKPLNFIQTLHASTD